MSKRNPRKKLKPEQFCEHIYPEDHIRVGEQCRAVKRRGSRFCNAHRPDRQVLLDQLKIAREARSGPPNEKHGFYTKTRKECDKCALADGCKYHEEGKKVCDYQLKTDINLDSLNSIKTFAEEIVQTEMQRYRKLEPYFDTENGYENLELHEVSSRIAKRMTSVLKDYSAIKDTYEKRNNTGSILDILSTPKKVRDRK